jgi:hypothetical protein
MSGKLPVGMQDVLHGCKPKMRKRKQGRKIVFTCADPKRKAINGLSLSVGKTMRNSRSEGQ